MAYSYNTRLVLVACLMVLGLAGLSRSLAQEICKGLDVEKLLSECGPYVQIPGPKIPPSEECCTLVRGIDVPCACKHIPGIAESFVSVEKTVYVARYCGIKLQTGSKCGKYTIPPPQI